MKTFLLIGSILAFFNSLGECAPPNADEARPLKKKVTFNANPEIIDDKVPNPDGNLIFNMHFIEFVKNFTQKSELYTKSTTEDQFLVTLATVIQCNFLVYNKVYVYMNGLDRFDTELRQIETTIESVITIIFPDSRTFAKLVHQKESLKGKLHRLLDAMQPSYDMVEHLLKMMNSMDADTKIDPKIYKRMYKESRRVVKVSAKFDDVFTDFPLEQYRNGLDTIRKATNYFESGDFGIALAGQSLDASVPVVNEIWSKLEVVANNGLQINFTKLFDATTKVHGFVMQALNVVDEASSSERDTKRKGKDLQSLSNFFGKLSIKK